MLIVPTGAFAAQRLSVILAQQTVTIVLRQLATGLYMNVATSEKQIVGLVICQNRNRIVRDAYLGFIGDFIFNDTTDQGEDPYFTGLGTRFQLLYLETTDSLTGIG